MRALGGALQQALACVARSVLLADGHAPEGGPYTLTLAGGDPVPLGGLARLRLGVRHNYLVVRDAGDARLWTVRTTGYAYRIVLATGAPLLAYHWHSRSRSPVREPPVHLHTHTAPLDLTRGHLPTGLVLLPGVLRWLLRDVGVIPLRSDWPAVLDQAEAALRVDAPGR